MDSNKVDIQLILDKIRKGKRSLIITLPESIDWSDYCVELHKAEKHRKKLNFRVYEFPVGISKGDRCYVVHRGLIVGWMEIVGLSEKRGFCQLAQKKVKGKFIERSGPFHYIKEKMPHRDFQGFRYFDMDEYKLNNNISNGA